MFRLPVLAYPRGGQGVLIRLFYVGSVMDEMALEQVFLRVLRFAAVSIISPLLHSYCFIFVFMLPCIVIDFFLNNQPDAPIIQIYSVIKLYMFRAPSLPIIRSFLLYIRHWRVSCGFLMTASKQSKDGSSLPTCTRHGHRHRVTATRGCINTFCLSWWWAWCARNMYRVKNKNKYIEKNCASRWSFIRIITGCTANKI